MNERRQINWKQERLGCWLFLILALIFMIFPLFWRVIITRHYDRGIYDVSTVPRKKVAIVFGAAVLRDGRLSTVLRDRMEIAIQLYNENIVEKILVSGSTKVSGYNEPDAMRAYAIQRGVPAEDVKTDYGGLRTYDTCYRASLIFGVDEAVLVSQAFHLPRTLFICDRLQIKAVGVAADVRNYRAARWYEIRETAATLVALWDTFRLQEPAVFDDRLG